MAFEFKNLRRLAQQGDQVVEDPEEKRSFVFSNLRRAVEAGEFGGSFSIEKSKTGLGDAFRGGVKHGLLAPFSVLGVDPGEQKLDTGLEKVVNFLGEFTGFGISFIPFVSGAGMVLRGVGLASRARNLGRTVPALQEAIKAARATGRTSLIPGLSADLSQAVKSKAFYEFTRNTLAGSAQFAGTSEELEEVPRNLIEGAAFGAGIEALFLARAIRSRKGLLEPGTSLVAPVRLADEVDVMPTPNDSPGVAVVKYENLFPDQFDEVFYWTVHPNQAPERISSPLGLIAPEPTVKGLLAPPKGMTRNTQIEIQQRIEFAETRAEVVKKAKGVSKKEPSIVQTKAALQEEHVATAKYVELDKTEVDQVKQAASAQGIEKRAAGTRIKKTGQGAFVANDDTLITATKVSQKGNPVGPFFLSREGRVVHTASSVPKARKWIKDNPVGIEEPTKIPEPTFESGLTLVQERRASLERQAVQGDESAQRSLAALDEPDFIDLSEPKLPDFVDEDELAKIDLMEAGLEPQVVTRSVGDKTDVIMHNPLDPAEKLTEKQLAQWRRTGFMEGELVIHKNRRLQVIEPEGDNLLTVIDPFSRVPLAFKVNTGDVASTFEVAVKAPKGKTVLDRDMIHRQVEGLRSTKPFFSVADPDSGLVYHGYVDMTGTQPIEIDLKLSRRPPTEKAPDGSTPKSEFTRLFNKARADGAPFVLAKSHGRTKTIHVFDQDKINFIYPPGGQYSPTVANHPSQLRGIGEDLIIGDRANPPSGPALGGPLNRAEIMRDPNDPARSIQIRNFTPSTNAHTTLALQQAGFPEKEITRILDEVQIVQDRSIKELAGDEFKAMEAEGYLLSGGCE